MLKIKELYKSYEDDYILENINCEFYKGDHVGIVGNNGVGKTTLLRILLGEENYDRGQITYPRNLIVSYLPQHPKERDQSVKEIMSCIRKQLQGIIRRGTTYGKALKDLAKEVEASLKDMGEEWSQLSGGEKTKLQLLESLSKEADIYILDEPTNHLDLQSIEYLKRVIGASEKTFIFISHDRDFLNGASEKIYEITRDQVYIYQGNYDAYKEQKAILLETSLNTYKKQQREKKQLKEQIKMKRDMYGKAHHQAGQNDFLRSKAKKHASTVRSMEKKLDRLLDQEIGDPLDESKAAFDRLRHFIGEQHLPKVLIRLEKVTMSFGAETVFEDVDLLIKRNEKIGIVGPNGAGKSTLLKLIVNQLQPTKGKMTYSPSLSFGYFAQQLENINEENTIYEEVRVPDMEQGEIRKVLANFLFRKERVFTQIKNLSMGERCRVAFVKLLLQKHNVLVLDEMTNHMDIQSKECLEEALVHFPGCVIFVSHDQYFLKKLASKVIEIGNKKVQKIAHSYKAYIEKKVDNHVKEGAGALSELETKKLQDRMAIIENRMSMLNSRLSIGSLGEEERLREEKDFFDLCQEMKNLKSLIG